MQQQSLESVLRQTGPDVLFSTGAEAVGAWQAGALVTVETDSLACWVWQSAKQSETDGDTSSAMLRAALIAANTRRLWKYRPIQ